MLYKMRGMDAAVSGLYDTWSAPEPDSEAAFYNGPLAKPLRDVVIIDRWQEAPQPTAADPIELEDAFADLSLEMDALGEKFRVAQAQQNQLAANTSQIATNTSDLAAHKGAGGTVHAVATPSAAGFLSGADKTKLDGISVSSVSSEFWAPPAVAHPNSDEFTAAALDLGKWTLCKGSDWSGLTSVGNVDSMTSPATGTVRVTQSNSRLYLQPALAMEVAVRKKVNIASPGAQFSARLRMPVPASSKDPWETYTFLTLAGASGGANATPNTAHRADIGWACQGANINTWVASCTSAGTMVGQYSGPNFDTTPADLEFRFVILNQLVQMWLIAGATKHYIGSLAVAAFALPFTGHLYWRVIAADATGNATLMPAAPIYDCDYVRQLDSINVY